MKSLYDEIRNANTTPRKSPKTFLPPAICAAIGWIVIGSFHLTKSNKVWMNWLIQNITTPFKLFVSGLCGNFPFAVAEIVILLAAQAGLVFLVRTVYLLIKRKNRLLRLGRRALALFAALTLIYAGYTVLWGVNYYGDDFSDLSGISSRSVSTDELTTLTTAFANALNDLAGEVSRDENGVFNEDLDSIFSSTDGLYDGICEEFPFLCSADRNAKRLITSAFMSRLDFTGFFFPFTGELLINDDAPACLVPATILHEMAHQRNIAGEDECNFVAIIAGLRCDNPVYQYSAALLGYIHLGNALYSTAPSVYREVFATLDDRVVADLAANSAYWEQFDTAVDEVLESVSTTVYEGFLQSYGESNGKKSYGMCVDLLVAYYFDYFWA